MRSLVAELSALERGSASDGERAAAELLAGRLRDAGCPEVRVVPYRGLRTYAAVHALHALLGLRLPVLAAVLLELEASGRMPTLRRLLPRHEGADVVARIPPRGDGPARATYVVVAHHDAARTGLAFRTLRPWRPARRSMGAFQALTALGVLLGRTRAGRALIALSVLADLDVARSPVVPGASDNATGCAALVALAESWRDGLHGVEVLLCSTGGEEAGMDGMRALLAELRLDPARSFVLGVDTLGAGTPIVARAEGTVLAHRYRPGDLALVDAGARRAGLPAPERWRLGGWTDPILARFAGLPSACLLSVGPDGLFTDYHLPTDTPDRVDWASVEACTAIARGVGEVLETREAARP